MGCWPRAYAFRVCTHVVEEDFARPSAAQPSAVGPVARTSLAYALMTGIFIFSYGRISEAFVERSVMMPVISARDTTA